MAVSTSCLLLTGMLRWRTRRRSLFLRTGVSIGMVVVALSFSACGPTVNQNSGNAVANQANNDPGAAAVSAGEPKTNDGPITVPLWPPLASDGLHDPTNPKLSYLQQPREALSALPPAHEGNFVDWVAALRSGAIAPRTNIFPETKIQVLDLDILMEETAGMPIVKFPHRPHTEWLDCNNCHDRIFVAKRGANPVNMFKVLQGEYCGQCHGAVSFPLTQCIRCHSVPRSSPAAQPSGGINP